MAWSKCAACNNTSFELKEARIQGSAWKHYFVQCSSCGGVVGVKEFSNTNALINRLSMAVKAIAQRAGVHVDL